MGTADDDRDGGDGGASGMRTTSTTTTRTTTTMQTTPTATARTPVPAPNVSVERERVLPQMVALSTPDLSAVYGDHDERFVLLTVDATEEANAPARESFTLSVGDRQHSPTVDVGGWSLEYYHALGSETIYDSDARAGDLVFSTSPTDTARAVTLSWPGGEATLDGVGAALARPATTFEVESFEAESHEPERVTLSVTVRNTGKARGWFVGAANRRGPSVLHIQATGFAVEAASEETATATRVDDGIIDGGTAEYTLRGAGEGDHVTTAEVAGAE
ncbi:hypothetical protein BRD10_03365 [Halobacteriales archaeon SW_12_71_31]|nr:MAG: hypothetical protein BRD10_03365 [Halobacteriales archaeon SW_12_71_31]